MDLGLKGLWEGEFHRVMGIRTLRTELCNAGIRRFRPAVPRVIRTALDERAHDCLEELFRIGSHVLDRVLHAVLILLFLLQFLFLRFKLFDLLPNFFLLLLDLLDQLIGFLQDG